MELEFYEYPRIHTHTLTSLKLSFLCEERRFTGEGDDEFLVDLFGILSLSGSSPGDILEACRLWELSSKV